MPPLLDQATRRVLTDRITAHVATGWPHLGEPVVTFRGRFCYVAITGRPSRWSRRTPPTSPVLRLRYQGDIDTWDIGIYRYTTESYTEAELPTSFGPVTGTPEEGINRTFPLYAGPSKNTN
jgi:hypothetical protein